ncbi:MAG TPA: hypothetical protein VN521_08245 [Negativicutes bacterium]|nr:hypothetical protein [Negativicutes bacterium]
MRMSKLFVAVFAAAIVAMFAVTASAASYYECAATGAEKNGSRKAEVKLRLNSDGVILSGLIVIPAATSKSAFPGGEYVYADGSKLTRDQGEYEWVMEANCTEKTSQVRSAVMARKFKIQNIAELQLKNKAGSVWFIFPHGWEYKQVSDDKGTEGKDRG